MTAIRIYPPGYDRRARGEQADVDRALEMLQVEIGPEEACIRGSVRDIRARLDALLCDLFPPDRPTTARDRLLRRLGLTPHARAADVALATLLRDRRPGTWLVSFGSALPEVRGHVADALDDAYCVMQPHEAAERARVRGSFFASRGNAP